MKISQIIAMVLAGIIGVASVISGSAVLLGLQEVGYTILNWLVLYNVMVGILSVITVFYIWKNFVLSMKIGSLILFLHTAVLVYLSFFSENAAVESIEAMTFRVGIWILIFILLQFGKTNSANNLKT